uniref:Uncharacterized protein n=1 Tax=Arundo donax TaxID=35708 RepID=A0A0A9AKB9_ARUDO
MSPHCHPTRNCSPFHLMMPPQPTLGASASSSL